MLSDAQVAVCLTVLLRSGSFHIGDLVIDLPGLLREDIQSALMWLVAEGSVEDVGNGIYQRTEDFRAYVWQMDRVELFSRDTEKLASVATQADLLMRRVADPDVAKAAIAMLFSEEMG